MFEFSPLGPSDKCYNWTKLLSPKYTRFLATGDQMLDSDSNMTSNHGYLDHKLKALVVRFSSGSTRYTTYYMNLGQLQRRCSLLHLFSFLDLYKIQFHRRHLHSRNYQFFDNRYSAFHPKSIFTMASNGSLDRIQNRLREW